MYPEKPNNNVHKAIASLIIIIAVALIAVGAHAYGNKQDSAGTAANTPAVVSSPPGGSDSGAANSTGANHNSSYKDGTYTARANYFVPHGYESISVTLSVKNGVVADSSIQNSESDPESARFQEDFASQYKSYVVGKNIADLHVPYLAGASDTAQGFDNAVLKIQNQAQA